MRRLHSLSGPRSDQRGLLPGRAGLDLGEVALTAHSVNAHADRRDAVRSILIRPSTARSLGAPSGQPIFSSRAREMTRPGRPTSADVSRASIGESATHRAPRHSTPWSPTIGRTALAARATRRRARCRSCSSAGIRTHAAERIGCVGWVAVGRDEQHAWNADARELDRRVVLAASGLRPRHRYRSRQYWSRQYRSPCRMIAPREH